MTPGPFQRTRDAAAKFIAEKFREGDVGGVVIDGKMANNRLTTDRKELEAAVKAAKMPGELRSRQLDLREWPRFVDEFEAFRIADNDQEALRAAVARACADDPDACRIARPDLQVREKAQRLVAAARVASSRVFTTLNSLANGSKFTTSKRFPRLSQVTPLGQVIGGESDNVWMDRPCNRNILSPPG